MNENIPDKVVLKKLESLSRDELNVVAKKLRIKSYRRVDQATLITVLAGTNNIRSQIFPSWWASHHNHVYFAATVLLALIGFYLSLWTPWPRETESENRSLSSSQQANMYAGNASVEDQQTIAVLYFEDLSADTEQSESLKKVLSSMMISFLSVSGNVTIVERMRIQEVYAELELSKSKQFNQQTVAKIGKLLGARQLVLGSYFFFEDTLRIDARLVDVETGATVVSEGANGSSTEFTNLLSGVSEKILAKIDQNAHDQNREFLVRQNLPKEDLKEIGKALDQLDNGNKESGIKILTQLKEKHVGFAPLISAIISQNTRDN